MKTIITTVPFLFLIIFIAYLIGPDLPLADYTFKEIILIFFPIYQLKIIFKEMYKGIM